MVDTDAGGGSAVALSQYMYEALREMVYADDPAEVKAVGEWLRERGRAVSDYALDLRGALADLHTVYASEQGAPALIAQLSKALGEAETLGEALINNGHTLVAAGDAIAQARRQVDAAATSPDTDGDGITATWRTRSPLDGRPHPSRPPVRRGPQHPPHQPRRQHRRTRRRRTSITWYTRRWTADTGHHRWWLVARGLAPGPGRQAPSGSPGIGLGPGGRAGAPPGVGGGRVSPVDGVIAPAPGGPRTGGGANRPGVGGVDGGPRLQVPGARSGDILGRQGSSPGAGGSGAGGVGRGGSSPGGVTPPGKGGPGGPGVPARPGVTPPGGGPGQPAVPEPGRGVPPGTLGPPAERDRPGKKKPGYERGEPNTFVDDRRGTATGGEVRRAAASKQVSPGRGVIGSQKQKPTEADGQSDWELPKVSPSPQGFPEELNDGTFRGKDGVQFEVRRRSRGR